MKKHFFLLVMAVALLAAPPVLLAGKGYMGGSGDLVVSEDTSGESDTTEGVPDTVDGPLNDKGSSAGKLFGDLYKIDRYQGEESYTKYEFTYDPDSGRVIAFTPIENTIAIGGEPILTDEVADYAVEDGSGGYKLEPAPYPSQCVQPVADYEKWDDISSATGLDRNRLPLIMTYDAQWTRTECEVGQLVGEHQIDPLTGDIITPDCSDTVTDNCINRYFLPPDEEFCPEGILWTDLVDEVGFGRLNLSRAPEAVLQAAFDEAISTINSDDTISISRDAAGRLLLEKNVYSESEVDECGAPAWLGTTFKAIDSPLENLAFYVKLIKDGHLVTPGDEREPIDRSEKGGIPIWKLLELSDGPSDSLRPTVDIEKMKANGFDNLVDVTAVDYCTDYLCYDASGTKVDCEGEGVASRKLIAFEGEGCGEKGIVSDDGSYAASGADFDFAAAFLAAAADKTGKIGVDMIVYLNSILGINKVVGYSAYDTDGNPTADAIDYSHEPVYFDFSSAVEPDGPLSYDRASVVGKPDRGGGMVSVLVGGEGSWTEQTIDLLDENQNSEVRFRSLGRDVLTGAPNGLLGATDILGFTQMADDDLSIIEFVHRYQIPELR